MKAGAERAERSEASKAPRPLRRHDYEHEHKYGLHNKNGRRESRAKRGERGASPYTDMITNMSTNMNSAMKTGAERAERIDASDAPPLHRHDYEHKHEHEHEYELNNENGHRASRAKRCERGAPLTQI